MGKVKSAIITALLAIAIIVAAFFATISYPVGTTQRYNSIASSITLGSDFTGSVYAIIYPEGVISAQEYAYLEDQAEDGESKTDYTKVGGVYVKNPEDGTSVEDAVAQLKASVASDAKIINQRVSEKAYSGYSVSVEDGLTIKINVPSKFNYATYAGYDESNWYTLRSTAASAISALSVYGPLTLRTTEQTITADTTTYNYQRDDYSDDATVDSAITYPMITRNNESFTDYFESVSYYTIGTTSVISINLTELGRERMKDITTQIASSSSQTLYFFMGTTQMLSYSCTSTLDSDKIELTSSSGETIENIAISLNSAVHGNALSLAYADLMSDDIRCTSAPYGENAALLAFVACLVIALGVIAAFFVAFKKLGFVTCLTTLVYVFAMIYAVYLLEIELTIAGIVTAVIGLILLSATNLAVFEEVRRQTKTGKTMQSSVKTAYKNTLMTVADIHIVLLVASIILTLVAAGEVAACGFILLVATVASYVLYWLTRFMWYVLSSPVRNKFKFCGFKREVVDDD